MTDPTVQQPAGIGTFERWLSLWVGLAIITGITLGSLVPGVFQLLASLQISPPCARSVTAPRG